MLARRDTVTDVAMRRLLLVLALVVAAWQLAAPGASEASGVTLFQTTSCLTTGLGHARVVLSWQGNSPTAQQQWVDISFRNNGWLPGTFVGAGPLSAQASSFTRDGVLANMTYYVRVNQRFPNGQWDPSATFTVTTPDCGGPPSNAVAAMGQLATLTVRPEGPMTGYERDLFGSGWLDLDQDGCDTRNEVLLRDMVDITFKPGSTCELATGTLLDPYTGKAIVWVQGPSTSAAVQIEHVVALGAAWRTGAADWAPAKRRQFANDQDHLLASDGPTNQDKSDDDAANWMPPNMGFRCAYVSIQVGIKARYSLWVTPAEYSAITSDLEGCGSAGPMGAHTWYTSKAASARYYYCDLDEGWKSLSPSNLRAFPSVEDLLANFPNRTKSPASKC
jgi:hypothetical protein